MGFLAPALPFLKTAAPWLIKGGAALGSTLLGSKTGGALSKPSGTEQNVIDMQLDQMRRSQQMSADLQRMGTDVQRLGTEQWLPESAGLMRGAVERGFNPVLDYWSGLLSGNRGAMTSRLAPELNQIADSYSAARQAAQLTPRGGGRASVMAQLPFQQARDVSTLLQTVRPQAAQGLLQAGQGLAGTGQAMAGVGTNILGAGSNLLSNAVQSMYGSTQAGRSILDFEAQRRKQAQELGSTIGGSLFGVLKPLLGNIASSVNIPGDIGRILQGGGGGGNPWDVPFQPPKLPFPWGIGNEEEPRAPTSWPGTASWPGTPPFVSGGRRA